MGQTAAENEIRILFLSDTHIGYDWPVRPRVNRRRRGDDFFNNYLRALKPAFDKNVDLVIHGGDLLDRSRLPGYVIERAFEPLLRVANLGIPVYVVPGNHERSLFRLTLLERHPSLHLFEEPGIYRFVKDGREIILCGFPFYRGAIRKWFPELMNRFAAQINTDKTVLLCVHHPFDGAQVGPKNFMFYKRDDTIDPADIPPWVDGVLSGHIHRRQLLRLRGNGRQVTVWYPGSVERTSFAEKNEDKGYIILSIAHDGPDGKPVRISGRFIDLAARPMKRLEWDVRNVTISEFRHRLDRVIRESHPECILRLILHNYKESLLPGALTNDLLRKITPASMNIEIAVSGNISSF